MIYTIESTITRESLKKSPEEFKGEFKITISELKDDSISLFLFPMVQILHQMIVSSETKHD